MLPQPLTTDIRGDSVTSSTRIGFSVHTGRMSLYFSAAVWASLALCVVYSLEDHIPCYRTEAAVASQSPDAMAEAGRPHPVIARHGF